MQISKMNTISSSLSGIYTLLIIFFTLFTLYFAQAIVIPLIIAALLTFFLAPLVNWLEKWIGRIAAILLVVLVVFSFIGFTGYIFAKQLILFGSNFPDYYKIMQAKIEAIQLPQGTFFNRISEAFGHFRDNLLGSGSTDVKLVDLSATVGSFIQWFFGSFFHVLALTAIVVLLVIFMLLNKEDIRARIIKLMGQTQISSATSAMNEASERVFTYLSRLLIVNVCSGICVTVALYLIGIPNPVLWGGFSAILRFIPYVGAWIATSIPIALSFTDSWMVPLLTITFFIILELFTAYVVEPFYYGEGTGVSAFALIFAAMFWTWLWGSIGLLLSTPLTVCLVVLGQYVKNMRFLQILLSKDHPLTFAEECYQRLLSSDSSDSREFIETYLKNNSLVALYDRVLIPTITQAEKDSRLEYIDLEQKEEVWQSVSEIIDFFSNDKTHEAAREHKYKPLGLPVQGERDAIGLNLLAHLIPMTTIKSLSLNDIKELINKEMPDIIYLVAVAPFVFNKIRFLCAKLHQHNPKIPLIVCLLGFTDIDAEIIEKLRLAGAKEVVASIDEAIKLSLLQ